MSAKVPILINYESIDEVFDHWRIPDHTRPQIQIVTAVTSWGEGYDSTCNDLIYYQEDKLVVAMSVNPMQPDYWKIAPSIVTIAELLDQNILLEVTKENIKEYFKSILVFV